MTKEETKVMLPLIQAYADGVQVEYKTQHGAWRVGNDINFMRGIEYRMELQNGKYAYFYNGRLKIGQ